MGVLRKGFSKMCCTIVDSKKSLYGGCISLGVVVLGFEPIDSQNMCDRNVFRVKFERECEYNTLNLTPFTT